MMANNEFSHSVRKRKGLSLGIVLMGSWPAHIIAFCVAHEPLRLALLVLLMAHERANGYAFALQCV